MYTYLARGASCQVVSQPHRRRPQRGLTLWCNSNPRGKEIYVYVYKCTCMPFYEL